MSTPSLRLAQNPLFKTPSRTLTEDQHIELGYERARVSAAEYGVPLHYLLFQSVAWKQTDNISSDLGLTADDVANLTPKFWNYHMDMVHTVSFATFVLVTIQYNLAGGTIAPYAANRPDLQRLMDRIMDFEVSYVIFKTTLSVTKGREQDN